MKKDLKNIIKKMIKLLNDEYSKDWTFQIYAYRNGGFKVKTFNKAIHSDTDCKSINTGDCTGGGVFLTFEQYYRPIVLTDECVSFYYDKLNQLLKIKYENI